MKTVIILMFVVFFSGCSSIADTVARPLSDIGSAMVATSPCGKDKIEYMDMGRYKSMCNGFTFYETKNLVMVVRDSLNIGILVAKNKRQCGVPCLQYVYSHSDISHIFGNRFPNIERDYRGIRCNLNGMGFDIVGANYDDTSLEGKMTAAVAILNNWSTLRGKWCDRE